MRTCACIIALSRAVLALATFAAALALAFSTRLATNAAAATTSACVRMSTTPPVSRRGSRCLQLVVYALVSEEEVTEEVTLPHFSWWGRVGRRGRLARGPQVHAMGNVEWRTLCIANDCIAARVCGRTGVPTGEKSPIVEVEAEVEARSSAASSEGTRSNAILVPTTVREVRSRHATKVWSRVECGRGACLA